MKEKNVKTNEDSNQKSSEQVLVQTPVGAIVARPTLLDEEMPGIDIVLVSGDGKETNLAVIEYLPDGESCDGDNHIDGDIIPAERTTINEVTLWSGKKMLTKVLTPGIVARIWNDPNREDPITIAYPNKS